MSKNLDFKAYNAFDLSHEHKFTCDMGELIPCLTREVVPGDIWRVDAKVFARLIPQVAPFMHQVDIFTHFFFVPNRLVNPDWEEFITKGFSGTSVVPWTYVQAPSGGFTKYSVYDYMRLPIGVAGIQVDAMPIRGYYLIVNEWYTNENVQTYTTIGTSTGQDTTTPGTIMKRNWQNDYFTGCLPWAQRGNPVYLPLSDGAVIGNGSDIHVSSSAGTVTDTSVLGWAQPAGAGYKYWSSNTASQTASTENIRWSTDPTKSGLVAQAQAATINDIRVAFQVQRWMEKNARGGVRYIEFLFSHFGEKSSDERLQRPEYLGGGRSFFVTSEVLQTSSTDSTSPQGNMAGHSYSGQKTMSMTRRFEEFGWIYCILSVMPRTQYQQGIERQWTRKTPLDYYFPTFSHLGQQGVLGQELCATGTSYDTSIFGFQDRFEELRTIPNGVSGDFRDTLNYWTMTRIFDINNPPQLNAQFVEADPTKRIFAVQNAKTCLIDIGFDIQCLRKVPKHGTPGLLDHA